eukprot:g34304.t1
MGGAGKLLGLFNCLWHCSAKTVAASLPTTTSPTSFSICLGLSDSLPKNLLKIAHALRGFAFISATTWRRSSSFPSFRNSFNLSLNTRLNSFS